MVILSLILERSTSISRSESWHKCIRVLSSVYCFLYKCCQELSGKYSCVLNCAFFFFFVTQISLLSAIIVLIAKIKTSCFLFTQHLVRRLSWVIQGQYINQYINNNTYKYFQTLGCVTSKAL